ncbi:MULTISPECIES: transcriptional regulator [Pseudonocardia]|uniref:Uncharacterized protein n=2 Tax=Pseudonocardia TaxID=1847 RepID=A0A1Y2MT67_PSEAH|nr:MULTISPECIES: transcriptional regulator [Pseudonocardia]OSY38341.1 hypothetical protein BG845_04102 [Pseudonocardia autotrophica]TDN72614.1 hypothetical protein C8E95_1672 [Pseudonocardia autotrophica]BBG03323.1 hypothetical protein Pdca_45320 [Pseudonocardia autotrophica]GEC24581.1 hypothetical protein PSA01_16100 [Pseudonocardia saturnea]
MATTTPLDLLVLHTLRCTGHTDLGRLAAATGLPPATVESELLDLAAAGLVVHATGPFASWGLSARGRAADADRIAAELAAAGTGPALTAALDRFLELNPELLDLCTAWQLRGAGGATVVNDHSDPEYDARVLDRFVDLDRRAAVVCEELTAALGRFGRYRPRLALALRRVRAGDLREATDSTTSFHTVWAELHEDLLTTLGIPR